MDAPPPSCLGEVRWSNDQIPPVCWGMSLKQFNDFVDACRVTPFWALACEKGHVNLYDVVSALVKPWTKNTGCSIALRMNAEKVLQAELMVSHSWSECMDQCSEALNKFCSRQEHVGYVALSLWFCAFAQYQSGDDPGDRGPTVAEQLALDPFGSVIRTLKASTLGMVVVQTEMADVYSRLWCVYEIAEAVAAKAKVSMAYSQRALETRSGSFEEMLRARTSRATCRDPSDEEMIRQKVQQAGGFSQLDSIIFKFRLQAFQEMMHELQESTKEKLRSEIHKLTQQGTGGTGRICKSAGSADELEGAALQVDDVLRQNGGGMTMVCMMICLAPLALVLGLIALPFIVLCAPCICLYRRRMQAKTVTACFRADGSDDLAATHRSQGPQAPQGALLPWSLPSHSCCDCVQIHTQKSRQKLDVGTTGALIGAGQAIEEEIGEEGEDELMLKRMEMAKKMAPDLFS